MTDTAGNRPARPHRVLVIDDDRMVRHVITRHLTSVGYDVVSAGNGAEGLRALQHDREIGLVLLDLMMPQMDGWSFRRAQMLEERLRQVPTVVMTGAPLAQVVHTELQAADYLLKPIGRDHLLSVVRSYCAPADTAEPARSA
jgi:CheY-like chemotaxis protein